MSERTVRGAFKLVLVAACVICLGQSAAAQSLLIDFSQVDSTGAFTTNSAPEPGYQQYNARHEVIGDVFETARTESYSAFGTTVDLMVSYPDTTDRRVRQMIARGAGHQANYVGEMLALVNDWVGIDARTINGGNGMDVPTTMLFTVSGLPAGDYSYRAFHHDTENQNGEFSVALTDAAGARDIGTFEMTASTLHDPNNLNPVNPGAGNGPEVLSSTVAFDFASDGVNPVVISYSITEGPNVHESFVGVNGIEIVPEPSTLMLLGVLAGGLRAFRRRRSA